MTARLQSVALLRGLSCLRLGARDAAGVTVDEVTACKAAPNGGEIASLYGYYFG